MDAHLSLVGTPELLTSGSVCPVGCKLHLLVEAQASKTPTVVAVENGDEYLTYDQLNSKLARILSQQGDDPGTVVAICFERGIPRSWLSSLSPHQAVRFLPLDPEDPTLRKEVLIIDTNAKILLSA